MDVPRIQLFLSSMRFSSNIQVNHNSTKYEKTIYCANCGDSRSVLCRNGTCVELNVCHNTSNGKEVQRVKEIGG